MQAKGEFKKGQIDHDVYTASWAVEVLGGKEMADTIARENGFKNLGKLKVCNLCFEQTENEHLIYRLEGK